MKNRTLLIGLALAILAGGAISTALGFYKNSLVGKFPPGSFVADVDVSMKTFSEAKKLLDSKIITYLETPIKIEVLAKTKEIKPSDLGITIFPEQSLRTLTPISLEKTKLSDLLGLISHQNESLPAIVNIDQNKLAATLEANFKLSEIAPKSAQASFGKNGEFIVTDGQPGATIDTNSLLKDLKLSARTLQPGEIKIPTFNQQPAVTKEDILAQQEKIKEELNMLITLEDPVYSDDWQIRLKKHPDWVRLVVKNKLKNPVTGETIYVDPSVGFGEKTVMIEISQAKLDEFINQNISKWLDRPAQDVKIYTDEKGRVVIEGKGGDGKKVQRVQLKTAIELALENKVAKIPVPTISISPKINISEDLQAKGITEKIAVGHTSYYGSPVNRVFNIKLGAEKFNGKLIAPDEIFSFNKNLGRVDASTGYRKELVIKPEGTLPDFGGGICQVSTTTYRAALFAGLPIVERNQHTYAVTYYSQILGHGLDATIYLGGPDLRFKNDTGHHILLQAYTEGDYELYVVVYGTADGRRVEMEGPYISNQVGPPPTQYIETTDLAPGVKKQLEKPHGGFDALWYRHLFSKDGVETKEAIGTHYKAMPSKIAVGLPAGQAGVAVTADSP